MPTFRYTAVDSAGKVIRGALDAANESMVADQLHAKGGMLLSANQLGRKGGAFAFLHADVEIRRGLPKAKIAYFTRELSVMLNAGQDIDHALKFLVESSEDKRMRPLLESLRNHVRGGKSLAVALNEHSRIFSRLYISIVRAGEAGGKLADCLGNLADLLERESRLAATVQSAMTYPALLILASVGTVVMLLTYVLPQFSPIFEQAGAKLPRPTRILIGVGNVVRDDGLWIVVTLLILGFLTYRAFQDSKTRLKVERAILRLPIVGTLTRRSQAARFMRTTGTLLRNGVGLVSTLTIARGVLANQLAAQTVDRAAFDVKSGRRLAASLAAGRFFPLQTIHLIELGEETGRLAEMSLRAADIHDEQVSQSVQRMVSILVPVITILMGVVVAGIVGSLLVAMLSLNDLAL